MKTALIATIVVTAGFFDIFEDIEDAFEDVTEYVSDGFIELGDAFKDEFEDAWDKPYHSIIRDYDDPVWQEET